MIKKLIDVRKFESNNFKKARGERVRYLRETLLRLNRKKFCLRHPIISDGTLLNWEYARYGGLSMKGAYALQEIFKKEGILNCSVEWLLHGIGETPTLMPIFYPKDFSNTFTESEDEKINKEINLFYLHHPNAIHTIIEDNLMHPYFGPGDYVAGVKCSLNSMENAFHQSCIIQTYDDAYLVRKIYSLNKKGQFLLKTNKSNNTESMNSIKILSIAPIIWIRRKIRNNF